MNRSMITVLIVMRMDKASNDYSSNRVISNGPVNWMATVRFHERGMSTALFPVRSVKKFNYCLGQFTVKICSALVFV